MKFCTRCGAQNNDEVRFCTQCGFSFAAIPEISVNNVTQPVPQPEYQQQPMQYQQQSQPVPQPEYQQQPMQYQQQSQPVPQPVYQEQPMQYQQQSQPVPQPVYQEQPMQYQQQNQPEPQPVYQQQPMQYQQQSQPVPQPVYQEQPMQYQQQSQPAPQPQYAPNPNYGMPAGAPVKKRKAKKPAKINKKLIAIIGIAVVAVAIVAVVLAVVFGGSNGSGKEINYEKFPLLFVNSDDEAQFKTNGDNTVKTLGETDEIPSNYLGITDDGKRIFFCEYNDSEYDLYYRDTSKKDGENASVLVEKGISEYEFSPDGKRVMFVKNGNLYASNLKKHEKLAKDVDYFSPSIDFKSAIYENEDGEVFYTNGKYDKKLADSGHAYFWDEDEILCYEFDSDYNQKISIVKTAENAKPLEIDSKIASFAAADDGKTFYYVKNDTLYYKKVSGTAVEILEDVNYVTGDWDGEGKNTGIFAVDYDDSLYLLEGKTAHLLCEKFDEDYFGGHRIIVTYDENKAYYRNGKKMTEIDLPDDIDSIEITDNAVYYIDEDLNLMMCKISGNKLDFDKAKEITDDVEYYSVSDDGKVLYINKEDNSFGIYDGKYTEVSNDYGYTVFKDGKKIVFIDDDDTLCYFNGKKTVDLEEDVEDAVAYGTKYIYFTNDDGELYEAKTNGKHKLVAEDVDYIIEPDEWVDLLSYHTEYWLY